MENKIIAIQAAIFAVCGNEMFEVMCDCHFTDEQHEGPCRIDRKEIHLGNLLKTIGIKDRTNGIGWYGIADDGSLLFLTEYAGKYDRGDVSLVGLTYDLSKSFDENLKNEKLVPNGQVYGVIANPVCTEFSTARSNGRARNPNEGMKLVQECLRIIKEADPVFWVIENPAKGVLKKYLGTPDYEYEPWWFGSPWTKRTALWGHFHKPERIYSKWEDVPKIDGLYTRPGRGKPSLAFMHKSHFDLIPEFQRLKRPESDMEFRSLCSQKFAQAFYQANQ